MVRRSRLESYQAINAFLMSNRDGSAFLSNIPGLLLDLFRVIVVLIAAAIIVSSVWGADLQGALVGLGVGGIVLGLALQDTLSAVFAGLAMVSTRNFKEGDWIKTINAIWRRNFALSVL